MQFNLPEEKKALAVMTELEGQQLRDSRTEVPDVSLFRCRESINTLHLLNENILFG